MEIKPFNFNNFDGSIQEDPDALHSQLSETEEKEVTTFSEEELRQQYQLGFDEGHRKGLEEGKGIQLQATHQLTQAITLLTTQTEQLNKQYDDYLQKNSSYILRAAVAIAQKVTMDESEELFIKRINTMLNHVTDIIISEPKVEIDIPANIEPLLKKEISTHFDNIGYNGQIIITPHDNMPISDCAIRWHNGGITRSKEVIWDEIEQLLHTQRSTLVASNPIDDNSTKDNNEPSNSDAINTETTVSATPPSTNLTEESNHE